MSLTQRLADELYNIDGFVNSGVVKFREWYKAAHNFLQKKEIEEFIYAKYGYAVEEYVNLSLLSRKVVPPRGYKIRLQVTHGNTRPDIVILRSGMGDKADEEIAWIDITSTSSAGHILGKSGSWLSARNYVAELLYDDLDLTKISTGGSIASHAAPRIMRAARQMNSRLMRHMAECMNDVLRAVKIGDVIRDINFAQLARLVQVNFGVGFPSNTKHAIIHSMLDMYSELPGIKFRDRAAKWKTAYARKKPKKSKNKAMSYITDSYNAKERCAYLWDEESEEDDGDTSGDYIPESASEERNYEESFDFEAYCDELHVMRDAAEREDEGEFDAEKFFGS